MLRAAVYVCLVVALFGPIAAALLGARGRAWAAVAAAPAVALALAAAISAVTPWGGRNSGESGAGDYLSNTRLLLASALLAFGMGVLASIVAAVMERVRRGPEWLRRGDR